MRKLRSDPLSQLDVVADVLFNGFLEDESGYFSDPSLYDHDDNTKDMDNSDVDNLKYSRIIRNKTRKMPAKFTQERVNIDEGVELQQQAVDMTEKHKGACIMNADIYSRKGVDMFPLKKCPKYKHNAEFEKDRKENSTSSNDSETDKVMTRQEIEYGKLMHNAQEVEKSDVVKTKNEIKSFPRRKKLCKAAELICVSGGKDKGKIKAKGYMRSVMQDNCNTGPLLGARLKKEIDVYTSDSDTYTKKDENECAWAEILGKAQPISRKRISGKKLDSKAILKDRTISKYEDLSSISKEVITSENQAATIRDGKMKDNQAVKDFCTSSETIYSVTEHRKLLFERNGENGVLGDDVSSGITEGGDGNREHERGDGSSNADPGARDVGWVLCDDCGKWRCIPSSLADSIEASNCIWLCKDNPDTKFADCSVPQEKTNSEINAELEITEGSYSNDDDDDEKDPAIDSKFYQSHLQTSWTLIKHNIFRHRHRKALSADEQMVCGCKRPEDGTPGCGEDCLNRMLSIECVAQTCPCGDACSNQQFQERLYKDVSSFRCGKKGFGLRVLEDVSMGAFIIEYVGEVLDMNAHEARQKEYAMKGQKHFYFMRLNSNEVIDACIKGNLGRFVNHSCEPNCRTEKWTVNGEICIGLFAIRDLKKGEEITFDYNYVRVTGAVPKKCLCGARECRGYIGGDPVTPVSIVESVSDGDDPEPIMIEESSEGDDSWAEDRKAILDKITMDKSSIVDGGGKPRLGRNVKKDIKQKIIKRKLTATKFGFSKLKMTTAATEGSDEVEDLNKLLDENGGLSRRMHNAEGTATCYMKVLALKATESLKETESGCMINAETCRSTRDLSMLLDVILKTQTRVVLLEAMKKNGLQILHGIIKHSKKDYKKTPIVRKALKVLEFLATKRILTPEQINSDPSYGSESLQETTYQLCRHVDSEVQQMAHRFRDSWINPFSIYKPRDGIHQASQQNSLRHNQCDGSKKRKHSRWDQPSQEVLDATVAGGLSQCFWPFNVANLVPAIKNNYPDQKLQHTQINTFCGVGKQYPDLSTSSVANGIPLGLSTGFVLQESSICVGIPVGHFHSVKTSQALPNSDQTNHNADDLGKSLTCNVMEIPEHTAHGSDVKPYDHGITFGNSHSHFFQQMYRLFGSVFHPWQLQALMAPQSWGPFVSGDARLKIVNTNFCLPTEPNIRDERMYSCAEPMQNINDHQEPEPPVPGLSPDHHGFLPPQPPSKHFSVGHQHGVYEHPGKSDLSHEQKSSVSWKPQRWNAPRRLVKAHGNKQRNIEFQYPHGYNQQNFQRKTHNGWEEGSFLQPSDICTETQYSHNDVFEEAENIRGPIPLEKPWGYCKED